MTYPYWHARWAESYARDAIEYSGVFATEPAAHEAASGKPMFSIRRFESGKVHGRMVAQDPQRLLVLKQRDRASQLIARARNIAIACEAIREERYEQTWDDPSTVKDLEYALHARVVILRRRAKALEEIAARGGAAPVPIEEGTS